MNQTKETRPTSCAGCLVLLVFFVILCASAFFCWKWGYWQGGIDEHEKVFNTQWTSSIQSNKHAFEEKINEYRHAHGLKPLKSNSILEQTAQNSAQALFLGERDWSHNGYEASISAQYRGWWIVGENLARNYSDFNFVMNSWDKSAEHKENLLEKDYCDVGIGVYEYVWVAHFGCRN